MSGLTPGCASPVPGSTSSADRAQGVTVAAPERVTSGDRAPRGEEGGWVAAPPAGGARVAPLSDTAAAVLRWEAGPRMRDAASGRTNKGRCRCRRRPGAAAGGRGGPSGELPPAAAASSGSCASPSPGGAGGRPCPAAWG